MHGHSTSLRPGLAQPPVSTDRLTTLGQRIGRLRRIRNLTQEGLAEMMTVNRVTIGRWETGARVPPRGTMPALAAALGTSTTWLEFGGDGGPQTVAIVGYVGAGQEVFAIEDGDTLDEVEAPYGTPADMRALIVRGDSMMPELAAGDLVLYRDQTQRPEDLIGRRCIVRVEDGRLLVKRLRRGADYGTFDLDSTNAAPITGVRILAAARVEAVIYR